MAENSFTFDLNQFLSTTLLNYRTKSGVMYDNVFKSNPTFYFMHEKGRKNFYYGGERIIVPLQYGKNSTVQNYSRYDPIDTTPQDNQTAAYYEIMQKSASIVIDGKSLRQNSGKFQLINLLKTKTGESEDSLSEEIGEDLWRITPETDAIFSIPSIVPLAPGTTDAATPGGIDGTAKAWWNNQSKQSAGTTWSMIVAEMRNLYNTCSKGSKKNAGGPPDFAVADQGSYEYVENHMATKERYIDADSIGGKARSVGFENIRFKNCNLFWDEFIPDAYGDGTTGYDSLAINASSDWKYGSIYFLNSKFMNYTVDVATDLKIGKFRTPHNQDAKIAPILHYHQLTCSNRAKQGVLHHITQGYTA